MVQGTVETADEQQKTATERGLARQDQAMRRAADIDLDDVPVYASTGVRRIYLSKSKRYWIDIQEELDFGQQTKLDNASVIGVMREQASGPGEDAAQTVRLDLERQRYLLCATWLVRWSIPDDKNGRPVKLPRHINDRIETIKRLHPKWGDAIVATITEHVAALQELEEAAQALEDEAVGIDHEEDGERDTDENPPHRSLNGESGDDDS